MKNKISNFLNCINLFGIVKGIDYTFFARYYPYFRIMPKRYDKPMYIRWNTSDYSTYAQVIDSEEYRNPFEQKDVKVIFDLGANIGLTSRYFANTYPEATIISIEPESTNYKTLQKNISGFENIHSFNCGIWDKSCFLKIVDSTTEKWAFQVVESEEETPIRAVSIDELMNQYNFDYIDILKIDIEGSEKQIFEQVGEWITKVSTIMIELHDRFIPNCTETFFKCILNTKRPFKMEISGETIMIMFYD